MEVTTADADSTEINTSLKPKKAKKQPAKTPKLTAGQIELQLVNFLDRVDPRFQPDFRALQGETGGCVLVAVENNTARITSKEVIASALSMFLNGLTGADTVYSVGIRKVECAVKAWMYSHPPQKLPPSWGFKDSPDLCFNRLSYNPEPTSTEEIRAKAPLFSRMLGRMENYSAFCARVGSLFYPRANRKQIAWVYGPSNAGKSQIAILLEGLLGSSVAYYREDDFDDAYWGSGLVDKRALFIKEPSHSLLQKKAFLALTGDSQTRINQKYVAQYTTELNTILFCASNDAPKVPNAQEFINRIIPCKMEAIPEDELLEESVVRARLFAEIPHIAGYCMGVYNAACSNHTAIRFDLTKHLQPSIDAFESEFLDTAEGRLNFGPEEWIGSHALKIIMLESGMNRRSERNAFLNFLHTRYKVTSHRKSTSRGYLGCSRK